uniref:asparaginase n=1 Tax=Syphacia muris TaxID=451379 RepID=A0A0N5AJT7_9BILA
MLRILYHGQFSNEPCRYRFHTQGRCIHSIGHDKILAQSIPARRTLHNSESITSESENQSYPESRVLVLYTGGTIGMKSHHGVYYPEENFLPQTIRNLPPLNDNDYVEKQYGNELVQPYCLPVLRQYNKRVVYWMVEYHPLLDSSDMTFDDWIRIAKDIYDAYNKYDGFVVLHGTDTLAYTACALSFMLENLGKPVVITGAQIPVSEVRSDGRENLICSLIIAGNLDIPEVTVYFNNKLMRGNRCIKVDSSGLDAFDSPNMLPLAKMEINIKVNYDSIYRAPPGPFRVTENLCRNISMLRIFPSMTIESVKAALQPPTAGVVLQTYGAGNMPTRRKDIINEIKKAVDRGCLVVNCSQCVRGQVDVNYATGKQLYDIGVIPGSDMTTEAAVIKLSYVAGNDEWDLPKKQIIMQQNLRGEMTVSTKTTLEDLNIIPELAQFLKISSSFEVEALKSALFPPLLCHAAKIGDLNLLEKLRSSGADFSIPDYNGRTPLHIAASVGQANAVNYLLQNGCCINTKDRFNQCALTLAVRSKSIDCIRLLRNAGAQINIDPEDLGLEMCLCVSRCDMDGLTAWLLAGADLNQSDYDGRKPLHIVSVCSYYN